MAKIKDDIIVKKSDVIDRINKLDKKTKNVFQLIYSEKNDSKIIKDDYLLRKRSFKLSEFWVKKLEVMKNKTGIYIILDKGDPIYVGIGGRIKNSDHDLYERVNQHALNQDGGIPKDNASVCSKFRKVNELLGCKVNDQDYKNWYGNLDVICISVGDISETEDVTFANNLEKILIALLRPMYNG